MHPTTDITRAPWSRSPKADDPATGTPTKLWGEECSLGNSIARDGSMNPQKYSSQGIYTEGREGEPTLIHALLCPRHTWFPCAFHILVYPTPLTPTSFRVWGSKRSSGSQRYILENCACSGFNSRRDVKKLWDPDAWGQTEIDQELFATSTWMVYAKVGVSSSETSLQVYNSVFSRP